jgi:hypothetical protein
MFPPAPANHATAHEGNVLGFFGRERFAINAPLPKGLPGCCLRGMQHFSKPMPENAKFAPVQAQSEAPEPIGVHQSISNEETIRTLDRYVEADFIKPHKLVGNAFQLRGRSISSLVLVSAS